MSKNNKEKEPENTPSVNPELEGFNLNIDSFGEIKSNMSIDKINEFLDDNVEDKKLKNRKDLDSSKE